MQKEPQSALSKQTEKRVGTQIDVSHNSFFESLAPSRKSGLSQGRPRVESTRVMTNQSFHHSSQVPFPANRRADLKKADRQLR